MQHCSAIVVGKMPRWEWPRFYMRFCLHFCEKNLRKDFEDILDVHQIYGLIPYLGDMFDLHGRSLSRLVLNVRHINWAQSNFYKRAGDVMITRHFNFKHIDWKPNQLECAMIVFY